MRKSFIVGKANFKKFNDTFIKINKSLFNNTVQMENRGIIYKKIPEGNYIEAFLISADFPSLSFNEYLFIGKRKIKENKSIFSYAEPEDISTITFDNICNHCGLNRHRNFYYIFKKDEKFIQIGSSCIDDFLQYAVKKSLDIYTNFIDRDEYIEKDRKAINNKFYCIDDIYLAAKNQTNNWTTWEKKNTSTYIKNDLKNNIKNNNVKLIEIKKALEEVESKFNNNKNEFNSAVLNLINEEGHFKRYYKEYEIGIISYALYSINLIKHCEGKWVGNIGDKVYVTGKLYYRGFKDNPFAYRGAPINMYELITENGIIYRVNSTVDVDELIYGNENYIKASINGIIGYQGTFKNYKYNLLKGRTKITKLE